MIKIYKTNESTGKLETVQSPIKGCWINMVAPTKEEIDYLVANGHLPKDEQEVSGEKVEKVAKTKKKKDNTEK